MRMKDYLARGMAGVVLLSLFACAKNTIKIEKPVTSASSGTTVSTGAGGTGPSSTGASNDKNTDAETAPPTPAYDVTSCAYTIQPNEWSVDGTNIPPGSVICIPAGTRGALLIKNFKGTADHPIVILNKGGKVTFSTAVTASYAFKAVNCRYFKLLGSGTAGVKYGFKTTGGNIGITMDDRSSDLEIANVEVFNTGFAGIMAKTDPTCDLLTQRGQFTMANVIVHNNYVHKTGGEGLYIGNSFYAQGVSLACGLLFPHDVRGLKVYNNLVDSTGCEGIQVGSAVADCIIYNNTVKNPGLAPFASGQNNGIQIGEGTTGRCYKNIVRNAPGNGIIVLGWGDNTISNNYIINSGAYGIFADSRYTPGQFFRFINNTIITAGQGGIKLNSELIPINAVINNVIIVAAPANAIIRKSIDVKLTALTNYISTDVNTCGFVNFAAGDFRLQPTSPLIDAGTDVLAYGVNVDYLLNKRPYGAAFDIGATEYVGE